MILPNVTDQYSPFVERERNRTLEAEDRRNRKAGDDVEVGAAKLVLTSPDGTRWSVTVDNSGTLSATSL